jgi:4'-phosphopantetheinyl transferase
MCFPRGGVMHLSHGGRLEDDEVDVWTFGGEFPESLIFRLRRILSGAELRRVDRLGDLKDRRRSIVSRACLRLLIGEYIGIAPSRVPLAVTAHGKPVLVGGGQASSLRFSVSHSANVVVVALTKSRNIGIDIEAIRPFPGSDEVASRFFSSFEARAYRGPSGSLHSIGPGRARRPL